MTKTIRFHRIVEQITTDTDKRFEMVARMADTIVEATLETGDCVQKDFLAKGFAQQEISALWHFANALAAIELKSCQHNINSVFVRDVRHA
ncbi:MAG: hypothetical protein PHD48_00525 [Alphaproteobacteria bacterium]|nr:hypothetical protein [Alphaproteobacteria bacterium]